MRHDSDRPQPCRPAVALLPPLGLLDDRPDRTGCGPGLVRGAIARGVRGAGVSRRRPRCAGSEIQALASHALTIAVVDHRVHAGADRRDRDSPRGVAGCRSSDYLALHRPKRADLVVGILIVAVLMPLGDLSSWLTGRDLVPPAVVDMLQAPRAARAYAGAAGDRAHRGGAADGGIAVPRISASADMRSRGWAVAARSG